MSRKVPRRTSLKSSSSYYSPSPGIKPSNAEAFLFEVGPIDADLSSKLSGSAVKTTKRNTHKVSHEISTSTRKLRNCMPSLRDGFSSNTSEATESGAKLSVTKKIRRKKKVRCTEDLNNLQGEVTYFEDDTKIKSKTSKKAKRRNVLCQVDLFAENAATTYSDNKENETGSEKSVVLRRGRTRRARKNTSRKRNSGKADGSKKSICSQISTTDSDNKEEELLRIPRKSKKNILKKTITKLSDETEDSTVSSTRSESFSLNRATNLKPQINITRASSVGGSILESAICPEDQAVKKTTLRREDTFEISSVDPDELFSEGLNAITCTNEESRRETYAVVPKPGECAKKASVSNDVIETIDLTESVHEPKQDQSNELKRNTFDLVDRTSSVQTNRRTRSKGINRSAFYADNSFVAATVSPTVKGSLNDRTSSFEISFNRKGPSSGILENLNITRRESRKSSFKKSTTGFKYSVGSESEDGKNNFVTIRKRQYHTMIDFDTGSSHDAFSNEMNTGLGKLENSENLNEQVLTRKSMRLINQESYSDSSKLPPISKASPIQRGNLTKSFGGRKNTSEIAPEIAESRKSPASETFSITSTVNEGTPNKTTHRDIFDVIARTSTAEFVGLSDEPSPSQSPAVSEPSAAKAFPSQQLIGRPLGGRRDTFEVVESYYDSPEGERLPFEPAVTTKSEDTANETARQDIFDIVRKTPKSELDGMMIGSGESVLLANSFINETYKSIVPRVTRMSTFTKDEQGPDSSQVEKRKSTRKRWSEVERVPLFNKSSPAVLSNVTLNTTKGKSVTFSSTPPQPGPTPTLRNKTLENVLKGKKPVKINSSTSVSNVTLNNTKFNAVSLCASPRKSELSTTRSEFTMEHKSIAKKSVRIESPLTTPKVRLHSPLVARKTPKPKYDANDNSILAGNCAPSNIPSATSTPFPKTEVSLLKKVLTNEKNKTEKSIKGSTSKVKMPNFSKIHEKRFEKMENIKELQERKALRAQYLLSGAKAVPKPDTSKKVEKESKKKLIFGPPKAKRESNLHKKLSKPVQRMLNKRASLEKQKKEAKSKLPVLANRFNSSTPSKPQRMVTEQAPRDKKKADSTVETKTHTRFGFKIGKNDGTTKEAQIKAVVTKSKLAVNRTDQNRKQLAVVRTNRRFELLMQMRAKQK